MRRTAQKNSHNTAALAGRASHVGHEPFPLEQRIMRTPQLFEVARNFMLEWPFVRERTCGA